MPLKSDQQILDMFYGKAGLSSQGMKLRAESALNLQHQYCQEWFGFWAGDRAWYDTGILTPRKGMVVINRVKPLVTATAGLMRQLSRVPDYQAQDDDNQQQIAKSEYTNGVSDAFRDRMAAEQVESLQNLHMLIGGYGVIDTNISIESYGTTRDPNGEIIAENVCPWDVWWDPMARAPNLIDARYVFRKKKFLLEDAEALFDASEEDFAYDYSTTNENYEFFPGGNIDRIAITEPGSGTDRDMVDVFYLQWWDREPFWRVQNPATKLAQINPQLAQFFVEGLKNLQKLRMDETDKRQQPDLFAFNPMDDILVLDKAMYKDIKAAFDKFADVFETYGIEPEFDKGMRRVYYTAIFTRQKVFTSFKSLNQDGFTIKFKTADYDLNNNIWFALVATLKEPTLYSNKALTEMLYIIAANSKGGVMYETSAVGDPVEFEQKWAETAGVIEVNDGAISGGKILEKAKAILPNGYDSLYPEFVQAIQDVFLIDKTALGNSDNKMETAQLQRQRIRQVYTTLAQYFDADILFVREQARLMLTYFQALAENAPGRHFAYVNGDGQRVQGQLNPQMLVGPYDIIIGEMPDTPTQKEEAASFLMTLSSTLIQVGINLYPVTLKYMRPLGIKQEDIQAMIQIMQPPPPDPNQQAAQQQLQQITLAQHKAEFQNKVADTAYKQAGVAERQANAAKTFSEAQHRHINNSAIIRYPDLMLTGGNKQ